MSNDKTTDGNGAEKPEAEKVVDLNEQVEAQRAEAAKDAPPARKPKPVTINDIELEELKDEASEYKHKYLHMLADAENARKRLQKERQDITRYAVETTVVDFLTPLDQLENALKYAQQMSPEIKHWAMGFQMILNQFKDALSNNGISSFTSEGKDFDPHFHEAVEMVETTEFSPGTIITQSAQGYKMGDRVIRPARVKVAKAPQTIIDNKEDENEE